jgi:DNA polymerase III subunit delta'
MVEEVRERVIRAAAYRPFEGGERVFVIEAAEAMRDESQNALLKTLEEPPEFVHLILLSSDQEGLLETVASRCQSIDFQPLPAEVLEAELAGEASPDEVTAAARLAGGDVERARLLMSERGHELRAEAERCVGAALDGKCSSAPWKALLDRAQVAGSDAEDAAREALEEESQAGIKRSAKEISDGAKRAGRRRRTEILALGFELCATWLRDLAAVASGAEEVVFNCDRLERLGAQAAGVEAAQARRGAEMVNETSRGLDLNVSEELALEALFFRLETLLAR